MTPCVVVIMKGVDDDDGGGDGDENEGDNENLPAATLAAASFAGSQKVTFV